MKIATLTSTAAMVGLLCLASAPAHAVSTEDFVKKASMTDAFEIESSKLALDKSQNKDVKRFAQRMIDDHTKSFEELKTAVHGTNVDPSLAKGKLDDDHQKIMDKLQEESGDDFTKDYISAQTDGHKDAVKLFSDYSENGKNAELKSFAGDTLPTLKKHLKHVKDLKSKM